VSGNNPTSKNNKMKKIYDINNKISIWADNLQYVVKIALNKKKTSKKQAYEYWYLPTLHACFEEIYECLLKEKLTAKVQKDISDIKATFLKVKEDILNAVRE